MSNVLAALDAFLQEHRRFGEVGVQGRAGARAPYRCAASRAGRAAPRDHLTCPLGAGDGGRLRSARLTPRWTAPVFFSGASV
jgi:hypothetical protein